MFSQRSLDENADPNVSASIKNGKYSIPFTCIFFANIYLARSRMFDNIRMLGFLCHASNLVVTTTPSQRRLNLFDLTPQPGLTHINSSANPYSPKQSASSGITITFQKLYNFRIVSSSTFNFFNPCLSSLATKSSSSNITE